MTSSAFVWIALIFAAICLWQMLAGLAKMRRAKADPRAPEAPILRRFGQIQAIAGGAMLLLNILFNLPLLRLIAS